VNHVQPAGNEPCADLFLLRDDVIFLNHGSFGACPRPVFARFQAWQRELEEEPVEFLGRRFQRLMDESRGDLATYVGAGKDDIAYVANATTGLNIIARSLAPTCRGRRGAGDRSRVRRTRPHLAIHLCQAWRRLQADARLPSDYEQRTGNR